MGTINARDMDVAMVTGEDDADPPALNSQSAPLEQSGTSEPTSSTPSGSPTETPSVEADGNRDGIGTTESATSSRASLVAT